MLGLDQYMKQSIQEGLYEGDKAIFEYRSKETPKLEEWREMARKISSEYADKGLQVCGTDFSEISYTTMTDAIYGDPEANDPQYKIQGISHKHMVTLAARFLDRKIYSNDPEFLKLMGYEPRKNPGFDPESFHLPTDYGHKTCTVAQLYAHNVNQL